MSERHPTITELRRGRRRLAPRRILVLALAAAALTPAAAIARPADSTVVPAPRATTPTMDAATARLVAQARHHAGEPRATTTTAAAATPRSPASADDGTSWSTIVLVGLGGLVAGAGAVAIAGRRQRVRHSRIPA